MCVFRPHDDHDYDDDFMKCTYALFWFYGSYVCIMSLVSPSMPSFWIFCVYLFGNSIRFFLFRRRDFIA